MSDVYKTMETPVGMLKLVGNDTGLAAVLWENDDPRRVPLTAMALDDHHPLLVESERQLREYFDRRRRIFTLALDFRGTSFQMKVWRALLGIPFGETRTYGEVATIVGEPRAFRAVGAANGRNPISIIVPCHRVVGASGRLTGFAGGLQAKEFLLNLEGARVGETVFA